MAAVYVIIVIIGLIVGSFVNLLVYRIPQGKSLFSPHSCPDCGARLTMPEIVPVAGYITLRGKCRHCGARIPPRCLLVEFMTAVVFAVLYHKYKLSVPLFAFAFLMTILIAIFFIDIDHRIIPNGLVLAGLAGGFIFFVVNCFKPMPGIFGDDRWWTPLAGLLPGSGFLLLVAILGSIFYKTEDAMGMGDVKLMAPIGLFTGWKLCLAALFISVAIGGIASIFLLLTGTKKRKDTVAFGPFIVTGTFISIIWGWDLFSWYFGRY